MSPITGQSHDRHPQYTGACTLFKKPETANKYSKLERNCTLCHNKTEVTISTLFILLSIMVWYIPSGIDKWNIWIYEDTLRGGNFWYPMFWCLWCFTAYTQIRTCRQKARVYGNRLPGCWSVLSPTRKETSYSDQAVTFARHSKTIQKFVRPTRSPRQQWPTRRKKNGDLSIVSSVGSG